MKSGTFEFLGDALSTAAVVRSMTPLLQRARLCCLALLALVLCGGPAAAEFGSKGGAKPANIEELASLLRQDPYDLELLISFGTSSGGSAGHLALAIRGQPDEDDIVYSANFYADRSRKHSNGFYTADLMLAIPKSEYLFGTTSSLGDTASFGLDFGEVYKRSVIGVRVFGVPAEEKAAVAAFHGRAAELRAPRPDPAGPRCNGLLAARGGG